MLRSSKQAIALGALSLVIGRDAVGRRRTSLGYLHYWTDGWTSHHQGAGEWSTGPRVQHPRYLAKPWRRRIQDEDIPRDHEVSAENII